MENPSGEVNAPSSVLSELVKVTQNVIGTGQSDKMWTLGEETVGSVLYSHVR